MKPTEGSRNAADGPHNRRREKAALLSLGFIGLLASAHYLPAVPCGGDLVSLLIELAVSLPSPRVKIYM